MSGRTKEELARKKAQEQNAKAKKKKTAQKKKAEGKSLGLSLPMVERKLPTLSKQDQKSALDRVTANRKTEKRTAEKPNYRKNTNDKRYNPLIRSVTPLVRDSSPEIDNFAEATLRKTAQGFEGALVGYSDLRNMKRAEDILTGEYNNRFVPGVKSGVRMQVDDPMQLRRAEAEAKKSGFNSAEDWEIAKANELIRANNDFYRRKEALDADVDAQGYTGIKKHIPEIAEQIGSMIPTMAVGAASGGIGAAAGLTGGAAWALNTVLTGGEIGGRVSGSESRQVYNALLQQNNARAAWALGRELSIDDYRDAIKKANTTGELVGIAEAGTEALFGGLPFLGKGLMNVAAAKVGWEVLSPATRQSIRAWRNTTTGRIFRQVAERTSGAIGEGVEEAIMTLAQPAIESKVAGLENEVTLSDIIHDFGMGAAVSLVLGVPVTVAETADAVGTAINSLDAKAEILSAFENRTKEMVEAGLTTPEEAQAKVQEIKDVLNGRGSLRVNDVNREVKTTSDTKEVYGTVQEAQKALQEKAKGRNAGEEVSVAVVENGVAETWTARVTENGMEQMQLGTTTAEDRQAYTDKAQRMANAKTPTERSGIQYNVKEEIVQEVSELSNVLGKEVEFFSAKANVHGYVENGKIYVNANSSQSPAAAVIAHEMTHLLEGTKGYNEVVGMIWDNYGSSLQAKKDEIRDNYKAAGKDLNETDLEYELVAMFVEEKLLTDSDTIRQLATKDRTVVQKIVDWINNLIQKITGTREQRVLLDARKKWMAALVENKTAPESGVKYSAGYRGIDVPKSEYRIISQEFMNKISAFWAKGLPVPNYIEVNTYFAGYSCLVTDKENGYFIVADEYELVNIHDIEEFEKGSDIDANKRTKTDVQGVSTDRFSGQSIGERSVGSIKDKRSATADGGLYERSGSFDLRRGNRQNSRIDKINKQYSIGKMQDESLASFNLQELEDRIAELQKQDSQLNSRLDEYRNAPEHQKMMNAIGILKDDELDRAVDEYKKWYTSSGYEALYNEEQAVYDELRKLRVELEDAKKEKAKNDKLNYRALFNEEFNKKYATKAARHFGTTYKFDYAGYLTVNGSLLDFSAGQRYRVRDHREISEVLDFLPEDHGYSDALIEFMNMGNIRMQSYGIDISVAPNAKQKTILRKFFDSLFGEVTVDFSRENGDSAGSVDYPEGTRSERIIRDIDNYFKTGVVPEISETQRYRFSIGRSEDAAYADKDLRDLIKTENRKMREVFYSRSVPDREVLWDMIKDEEKHIAETGSYRHNVVQDIIDFAYETGYRYINEEMEPVNSLGKVSISVPERYRGEMDTLNGLAEVNRQMFGSGIMFTYKPNKHPLDDAYATLQAENQGIMPESTDPSEQIQNILDVFGRSARESLRELDSDEYNPFAGRENPYRKDIENTVRDAVDSIQALAVKKIAAQNRQQGQQEVNRWVAKTMQKEARNYTVGSVVELGGQRGTVSERKTKGRSVSYVIALDNGETRENVKPEELTVAVTPDLYFDELPEDQQNAWQEPPEGWDVSRDLADVAPVPIDMKEYREILYENGITVGVRKLNDWFKRNGWLKKIDRHYFPTEKALKEGYFQRERYGNKITAEGQQYFLDLFTRNADAFIDPEDGNDLVLPGNKPAKDSPTEERDYLEMLYEYENEIVDTGQDYSWAEALTGKGVTYSKDYARNFDAAAKHNPTLRNHLQQLFARPLETAKADYAKAVRSRLTEMHDKMRELGIKKDTKASQAVQWIGEGFYQDKFGETHEYTIEMLKEEFPETWENIRDAATYFRHLYDEYLGEINAARELIYPHPLEDAQDQVAAYMLRRDRATDKIIELRATISELETVIAAKKSEYDGADAELQRSIRYNEDRLNKAKISLGDYISRRSKYIEKIKQIQADIDSGDILRNKRIVPRKDYFHHFQEMSDSLGDVFALSRNSVEIDPRLEGTSGYTEPKSKFSGITLRRNHGRYKADAVEGFVRYAQVAEYMKHIDPVISQFRSHIAGMANATKDSRNANKLIRWLVQWTNDLAGKTNPADRFLQDVIGREAVQFARKINSRAKANAVVGNLNSATAQIFNLPNLVGHVKDPKAYVEGFADLCKFIAREKSTRDLVKESGFLNERYLDDVIKSFDEKAIKKPEKVAAWTLTVGDRYSTALIWFVAHHEAVNKGIVNPVEYADDITRRCVAGRGIGEIPITQKSNITQIFAPFQIEVNNAWQLYKEKITGVKTANTKKEKAISFMQFLCIIIANFMLNTVTDLLIHRRVTFDPIYVLFQCIADWMGEDEEEETNWAERFVELMGRESGEIISNMPYGSLIAYYAFNNQWARENLFGDQDPTRFGVGNTAMEWAVGFVDSLATGKDVVDDAVGFLTTFVMPFGGKQAERSLQALVDTGVLPQVKWGWKEGLTLGRVDAPGSYSKNGEYQFPLHTAKTDFSQWIANLFFGKYATDSGQKYLGKDYENGTFWQNVFGFNKTKERKALSERATAVMKDLAKSGADVFEVYDTIRAIQDAKDTYGKNNVLRYSELTQDEKVKIILGYMTQKDDIESTEKKINAVLGVGLTVDDYLDIRNMYTIINKNEDLKSASDKANQFVKELAAAGYTSEQIAGIYEGMSFWQSIPANIDKFTEMTSSGLDSETAILVQEAFDALEPLPGKTQVTALQKVEAIANLGLSSEKENLALSQAMGKEQYAKYTATTDYGVNAKTWVDFQNALAAADAANGDESKRNGSYDKDEKRAALDSMDISNEAKAALWQTLDNYIGNESKDTAWKAARNPYSSKVGADIVEKYMEAKQSWTVKTPEASEDVSLNSMVAPLAGGGTITSGFGYRNTGIPGASTNHQAVDIAAPTGTDVGATIAGVVTRVSSSGGYGNSVEITSTDADGNTIVTKYSHLDNFGVAVGDSIAQGQKIGEVGNTGTSSGSHLDFKLGVNGEWVDPTQYLDLAAAGIVDGTSYAVQEGTGGNAAVIYNASSGGGSGSSGGGSSKKSYTTTGGSKVAAVTSNRTTNTGSAGTSGGSGGGGLSLPMASPRPAVTGRSVDSPTYGAKGLTLPKANANRPTPTISTSVATTQRTGRTGGSLWDPDVI